MITNVTLLWNNGMIKTLIKLIKLIQTPQVPESHIVFCEHHTFLWYESVFSSCALLEFSTVQKWSTISTLYSAQWP